MNKYLLLWYISNFKIGQHYLDRVDQPPELLEAAGDHQLVVCLVGADAVEPEVDQVARKTSLGFGQILRGVYQILNFFD